MRMPRILLLNSMLHPAGQELLSSRASVEVIPSTAPRNMFRQALQNADALVVRLPGRVTRQIIEEAPRLRVIGTAGAGVDHIDVSGATAAGIPVVNNVGIGPVPVAEHAVGLMLSLARRIVAGDRGVRRDRWACRERLIGPDLGIELTGRTVGIVGFGFIGQRVAMICQGGFGARVLAYDPFLDDGIFAAAGVERRRALRDLLSEADFVTLHVPLTEETRHVIGAEQVGYMKPTAYLINCARGAIVDEVALVRALRDGRIAGAGIDVFDPEPPAPENPLFQFENVVVTPHIAGLSQETSRRLSLSVAEQILQVLADERPPRLVNPEVWDRRRRG